MDTYSRVPISSNLNGYVQLKACKKETSTVTVEDAKFFHVTAKYILVKAI
jgi:hypothetical protein